MNRRGFLRFLGLAPVAAPIAVKAASASDLPAKGIALSHRDVSFIESRSYVEDFKRGFLSVNDVRRAEGLPPLSLNDPWGTA